MAFKKSTILFLPGGSHKVRKITIPQIIALFFICVSLLLITGVGWLVSDYKKIKSQIPELEHLKKENRIQKTHLVALTQKINHINQRMVKLQEFNHQLKAMTNIEPLKDQDQVWWVGGSDIENLTPEDRLDKINKGLIQQMHKSLEDLETETAVASISQKELNNFFKKQKSLLACTPSIKPTTGWYSSRFGYRISPFTNQREFHKGLDIATRIGTPIIAPADGLVVFAGREGNYGKILTINHGYNFITRYGHLHKYRVKKGQYVKRGQIIAEVGNTGRCTGSHLHYEVLLDGVPVNPLRYILN
jgi:murein DD-endopeptidase MepM/ murein hydrolase activator NlpD